MALEITYVGGFNPFEWDELFCPLCGNNHYVSISHAAVHCKDCCAQFSVRRTAGEPGCVVDCFVKDPPFEGQIYAPLWRCRDCGAEMGFFDFERPVCPTSRDHKMVRVQGLTMPWVGKANSPQHFYIVLKLGGECSGWIRLPGLESTGFPTQQQWEKFQRKYKDKISPKAYH